MNFCNFAKIIIARNSKETQKTTETTAETTTIRIPVFNNNVTVAKRYDFYQNVMNKYPKMYLTSMAFASNLPRLQKYITESKFWKNGNRNGEKRQFIENFNLQSWNKLSEREKHMHRLIDCIKCEAHNPTISSMHSSVSDITQNIIKKTNELAEEIQNLHAARLVDGAEQLVKMIEPIMEKTFKTSMKKTVSTQYNLTEKVPSEKKQREKIKSTKESSEKIAKIISNNDGEVASFLASGSSFSQRNRDRMNTYFETTQAARLRAACKTQKLKAGVQKPKKHVGKLENYFFDRDGFKKFIEALPSGSKVSWRNLGIRFQVRNKSGLRPSNAGQVLMEAAKSLGINVSKFNTEKRISGRDYAQRIRRARHKLLYKKVSIPASQPTRKLHTEIRRRLNNQEIYVGEMIAPKTYRRNHITSSGNLEEVDVVVHGRKIPLERIRRQMNLDQGLLIRWRKDDYENLDEETILERLSKLKIPVPSEPMSALDELMKVEHTRNMKVWHDHSDILNHSYVSFMISALYDPAVFLTDEEYKERYPDRPPVDVQSAVEKPYLYILGQSKATDVDQLSYTSTRLEDINSLHQPTYFKGTAIYDVLRVFSGDGPARQFEAGHQRGGNFSCLCGISVKEHQNLECALRFHPPTLSERMKILKSGVHWKKYSERNINPLCNLKKEALTDELEARGVDTYGKSVAEMKEKLVEILHGIQRPPALLSSDIHSLSLSRYEIPPCEPLHDLSNIVQNLITELPTHIEDNKVQVDFEKFANATIGDKNQLKGSDARLFAVKLAKFAHQKFTENGISKEILLLCTSLVEMISICYSHHHQRTPKTILRLYNQSFLFSVLCKTVIGTPKKMTTRKFYGCHFHSMTVHAPQTFRIFCLRSLIPEQEERSFGDMRRISLNTSSRQCGKIIDNAIVRFNAQQQNDRGDNYRRQESAISQQARLLPTGEDTRFPVEMLRTRSYLFQTHCERIADFLQEGLGIWWSMDGDNIVFHDGPMHQDQLLCSQHFRTDTVADSIKILDNCWSKCVSAFEKGDILLPLLKVKIFDGSKPKIIRNESK